jgi:hypothetical protein
MKVMPWLTTIRPTMSPMATMDISVATTVRMAAIQRASPFRSSQFTTGTRKKASATPTPKTKSAEAERANTSTHRIASSSAMTKGLLGAVAGRNRAESVVGVSPVTAWGVPGVSSPVGSGCASSLARAAAGSIAPPSMGGWCHEPSTAVTPVAADACAVRQRHPTS